VALSHRPFEKLDDRRTLFAHSGMGTLFQTRLQKRLEITAFEAIDWALGLLSKLLREVSQMNADCVAVRLRQVGQVALEFLGNLVQRGTNLWSRVFRYKRPAAKNEVAWIHSLRHLKDSYSEPVNGSLNLEQSHGRIVAVASLEQSLALLAEVPEAGGVDAILHAEIRHDLLRVA
jgi:hypothetical protein